MQKTTMQNTLNQYQITQTNSRLTKIYKKHSESLNTKFFKETRKAKKELAELCQNIDPKFSRKLLNCGGYIEKEYSLDGQTSVIKRATYCKDRACPQCSQIKAQMDNLVINRTISKVAIKHKLSLQFWTFSPVNVPIKFLAVMIDIISKSISHLFRNIRQYRRSIKASWITIEFKYNAELRTVNVHTHTIVGMTQDYFRKNNPDYIDVKSGKPQQEIVRIMLKVALSLQEEYLYNANLKTGEIKRKRKDCLDIQPLIDLLSINKTPNFEFKNILKGTDIKETSNIEEQIIKVTNYVTKYVTKIEDWIDLKGIDKTEVNPEDMAIILKVLRDEILGKQLNRPTGLFRKSKVEVATEIKEQLKQEKEQKFLNEQGEKMATIILAFILNQKTDSYEVVLTSENELYEKVEQQRIEEKEQLEEEELTTEEEEFLQERYYWNNVPKSVKEVISYFEQF